ncbi:MAG TPA: hypothetical protein VGV57_03965 [Thermoleophilaceae bacterium]|nr:hypothetical protein [Thermoleophilaceae bacterium]
MPRVGRLKNEWALLPLRVRGIERVRLHADLTILGKLTCALSRARSRRSRTYSGRVRPAFAPFAIGATAILAVNNLLIGLRLWPTVRLIVPVVALVLLLVAVTLWWRAT